MVADIALTTNNNKQRYMGGTEQTGNENEANGENRKDLPKLYDA